MSEVVGVFGDSYACRDFKKYNSTSWVDILANKFNYNVVCHAKMSTSLFWSYKQFIKYKDKYSKIIFSITSHDRLYSSSQHELTYPISSPSTIEMLLNSKTLQKTDSIYPALLAAQGYYKYLLEPEYCKWVQAKLIAEIIDTCHKESKQLIMMPMREDDIYCQNIFTSSLLDITNKEQITQFGDSKFRQEIKSRSCHMSQKNNLIMATLLDSLLQGKQRTISLSDFVFEKVDNPELYWKIK